MKNFSCQKGFSLLEVMVASMLGMLVIIAIMHVCLGVKSLYRTTQENARLQENVRFSTYFLTEKISMAGYIGCGNIANFDLKDSTKFAFVQQNIIHGYSSTKLPSSLAKYNIVANSDVLVIQKADENTATLTKNIGKKGGVTSIYVTEHPAVKDGDPLLISDCVAGDLFTSSNYKGMTIKTKDEIAHQYDYQNNTQVSRFTEIPYFISSTTNSKEKQRYGLYYATNGGNKEMIVDGVTMMKIKYGVDAKNIGKTSEYYTAEEVTAQNCWDKVLSVIITLSQSTKVGKAQSWDIYITLRERGS